MKRSLLKDALREIRRSMGRYLSIMAIVCLGVGFFAGVKAAGPDMITTAQTYYETSNLMDVHFQSTLGLTNDDVKAVQGLKNVNQTETGYTLDTIQSGEEDMYVIRLISLPETISLPRLIEGRFPENENEIVVENGAIISGEYAIGSTFTLSLDSDDILDSLKTDTFTVVGLIESPLYVTYKKGPSTLASGEVDLYGMVLPEAFCMDVYTDIYVTLQSTGQLVFNSAMYKETVTNFVDGLAQFESEREEYRYNTVKTEAQEEYDKEKTKAMDKLAKAKKKLDDAKKQLDDAQKTLDANRKKAEDGFKKAQETLDEINAVLATISEEDVIAMEQGIETLTSTIADLQNQKAQSEQQLSQLEAYLATLDPSSQEYAQYAGMAEQLRQGIAQIEQNLPALQAQLTELEGNYAKYLQLLEGKKQCEDALSKKKSTYKKLNEAQATINTNRKKYEDGLASYKKNYKKAMDELADAQKEIDDIEYPTWYSFTRDDNEGYSEYADNANRIAAIAQVFPVFFLLIAALVCLTSMTRMVEENRTQIGSYKALGYSTLQIATKYLLYSGSATVIGATVGLILGFRIFPTVIISAYNIMYRLPDASTPFLTEVAAYSIILSLAATFFATGMAVYKELQEVPASLLRPRSPANGKRVLLERWNWFWSKLSFSRKVTVRNLFRYKKRMIMTIIGIAGCTALMVTGFGIHDSITEIGQKQFEQIFLHDIIVVFKSEDTAADQYRASCGAYDIKDQTFVYSDSVKVLGDKNYDATLMVPEDEEQFRNFVVLKNEKTQEPLDFKEGVIVSQKLANLMNLQINSPITLSIGNTEYTTTVTDVCEFYTNHWIFLSPEYYTELTGQSCTPNQAYVTAYDHSVQTIQELSTQLTRDESVLALSKMSGIRNDFLDMISSLNTVVYVLIISAAGLAFIVLYNLTNINVTERIRELATIKVLGFRDHEVTGYLYRENVLLTVMGIVAGWGIGVLLHRIVMTTAEVDTMLFGKNIYFLSFVYASALTVIFSVLVNFVTHFSLKGINMIESLKSVE